jgi:hypothetical protein
MSCSSNCKKNNDTFRDLSSTHNQVHVSLPSPPVFVNHTVARNITVEVSESRFCIIPSLFRHIESLPWTSHRGTPRLNADPDVFEMILQYFMFSSLPDFNVLTHHKATKLLELTKPLEPIAVQRLVQYVEHYIVNNPETTFFFLQKRFASFSSVSSQNKSSTSRRSESATIDDKKDHPTTIPSQCRTVATQPPPPVPAADEQPPVHCTKSFPTSLVRIGSSSSDGSISKLSQPSSSTGGLPGQDENCMLQGLEILEGQQKHLSKMEAHCHDSSDILPSSCPKRVEHFESPSAFQRTTQSLRNIMRPTKSSNNTPKGIGKQETPQILGESQKQPSVSNAPTKKDSSISKKLLRNVFSTRRSDLGQRKMTHSDWCSSEYVL